MSTHNICFGSEIRKIFLIMHSYLETSQKHSSPSGNLCNYAERLPVCLSVTSPSFEHDLFGQRRPQVKSPKIGQFKDSKWWGVWITRVAQVVRASDQCLKSCGVEQQNLSVCLPACLSVWLSVCHKPMLHLLKA